MASCFLTESSDGELACRVVKWCVEPFISPRDRPKACQQNKFALYQTSIAALSAPPIDVRRRCDTKPIDFFVAPAKPKFPPVKLPIRQCCYISYLISLICLGCATNRVEARSGPSLETLTPCPVIGAVAPQLPPPITRPN